MLTLELNGDTISIVRKVIVNERRDYKKESLNIKTINGY